MKAKAIRPYTDKYTRESVEKGSVVEMTTERFEEINSTYLGVFVEKEEEATEHIAPLVEEVVVTEEAKPSEEVTAPLTEEETNTKGSEIETEKKKVKK